MSSTGVVRALDDLGRVCLPKEYRKVLEIGQYDELSIKIEDNKITIEKFENGCFSCGMKKEFKMFLNKRICVDCIQKLKDWMVNSV